MCLKYLPLTTFEAGEYHGLGELDNSSRFVCGEVQLTLSSVIRQLKKIKIETII